MTTGEHSDGMHSRDEVLAGEYVLGVLPIEKRREVERR
ncbi:MAG: anti-sigma factor, partial [Rhizobium oryzihabitans]